MVGAMEREVEGLYRDRRGSIHSVRTSPEAMSAPEGAFVVLVENDEMLGCGGLKRFEEGICEIKRMYVAPDARGRGLGEVLLEALEQRARDLGYAVARLDTGDRQMAAQRLYEGAGYRRIPKYNENNLATFWYEKRL